MYTHNMFDSSTEYGIDSISISDTYYAIGDWRSSSSKVRIYNLSDGTLNRTINAGGRHVQIYGDFIVTHSSSITYAYKPSDGTLVKSISSTVTNALLTKSNLFIADYTDTTDTGKVYVYDRPKYELLYSITNPNNETSSTYDKFGYSLSATEDFLFVGAPYEEETAQVGDNQGIVYGFRLSTGTQIFTQEPPDPVGSHAEDYFGQMVACNETDIFIASPSEEVTIDAVEKTDAGRIYHWQIT